MQNYGEAVAKAALQIHAIKFSTREPFCWASGYYMPIYNDNRMLLGSYRHRALIGDGLADLMQRQKITADIVAGVATAGIPHAVTLANKLETGLVYVRSQAKDHGLKNRVEGQLEKGQRAVVIEDVISTGGSCVEAIEAMRESGAEVAACLAIYSYGFASATSLFEQSRCPLYALLTYDTLLAVAKKENYLTESEFHDLEQWQLDPFGWGEKRGFQRRVK